MANKILKPTGDKGWKHCVKGSIIVTEKSLTNDNADTMSKTIWIVNESLSILI